MLAASMFSLYVLRETVRLSTRHLVGVLPLALLQSAHLDTNGMKLLRGQEDHSGFLRVSKNLASWRVS